MNRSMKVHVLLVGAGRPNEERRTHCGVFGVEQPKKGVDYPTPYLAESGDTFFAVELKELDRVTCIKCKKAKP